MLTLELGLDLKRKFSVCHNHKYVQTFQGKLSKTTSESRGKQNQFYIMGHSNCRKEDLKLKQAKIYK